MSRILEAICGDCLHNRNDSLDKAHELQRQSYSAAETPQELKGLASPHQISCVADLGSSHSSIVADAEGSLFSFDLYTGEIMKTWAGHSKPITKIAVRNGRLFTSSRDLTVKMWETEGGDSFLQVFKDFHSLVISALAYSPVDEVICTGSRDNTVALWDVETAQVIADCKIARNIVTDICWKGKVLAQTSEDKSLRLLDPRSLKVMCEFIRKRQILTSCDIDNDVIVTSSGGCNGTGCEVTVWDQRKGIGPVFEFTGHTGKVYQCCYVSTPGCSDQLVASVSADYSIRLWNVTKLQLISSFTLMNHPSCICQIGNSSDNILWFSIGCFTGGVAIVTFDLSRSIWNAYQEY